MVSRICIVPARANSKRLPGKNKKTLIDKPLFMWTLDAALPHFEAVVFSTDDLEMLELARKTYKNKYDNLILAKRPNILAEDDVGLFEVVSYYSKQYRNYYKQIWMASPACPFRNEQDIKDAFNLLGDKHDTLRVNGVVSAALPSASSNIELLKDPSGYLHLPEAKEKEVVITNNALNGMWMDWFEAKGNFYAGKILPVILPPERSLTITNAIDFTLAEVLLSKKE